MCGGGCGVNGRVGCPVAGGSGGGSHRRGGGGRAGQSAATRAPAAVAADFFELLRPLRRRQGVFQRQRQRRWRRGTTGSPSRRRRGADEQPHELSAPPSPYVLATAGSGHPPPPGRPPLPIHIPNASRRGRSDFPFPPSDATPYAVGAAGPRTQREPPVGHKSGSGRGGRSVGGGEEGRNGVEGQRAGVGDGDKGRGRQGRERQKVGGLGDMRRRDEEGGPLCRFSARRLCATNVASDNGVLPVGPIGDSTTVLRSDTDLTGRKDRVDMNEI